MVPLLKIVIVTFVVVGACCIVAVLVVPSVPASALDREEKARRMIHTLDAGAHAYRLSEGRFPPGDGDGSAELARALQTPRECGRAYVSFSAAMVTPKGDVRNPIDVERGVFHYRNNERLRPETRVGVHNAEAFDLWCQDAHGKADGICNWGLPEW